MGHGRSKIKKEVVVMIENVEEYIKPFSQRICEVREDKNNTFIDINKYFEKHKIVEDDIYGYKGRVWMLIGKRSDDVSSESLMVAQSENIHAEILEDVNSMYNAEYIKQKEKQNEWGMEKEIKYNLDVIKSPQIAKINSNDNIYLFQKGHEKIKNQYLYRYLKKTYKILKIYEIEIDKYINPSFNIEHREKDIYELAKDYYVESKLAVETNSLFWDYYKSGVGKRAYYMFRKMS